MCTAFRCIDIVYKSVAVFCIRIIMLHGNLYCHAILFSLAVNNFRIKGFLASVQVGYKFADTALIVECFFFLGVFTLIPENDAQPLGKKCHLTETLFQNIVIINGFFEDFFIRKECYSRSGLAFLTVTYDLKRVHCMASLVTLFVFFSLVINADFQPFRQCINN